MKLIAHVFYFFCAVFFMSSLFAMDESSSRSQELREFPDLTSSQSVEHWEGPGVLDNKTPVEIRDYFINASSYHEITSALIRQTTSPQAACIGLLSFIFLNKNKAGVDRSGAFNCVLQRRTDLPTDAIDALQFVKKHFIPEDSTQPIPLPTLNAAVKSGNRFLIDLFAKHLQVDPNQPNQDGIIPLCETSDFSLIQFLMEHGADINAQDKRGKTRLHHAVIRNESALLKQLLSVKGIDPNCKDNRNRTPLHFAALQPTAPDLGTMLLLNNAVDPAAKDARDQTALHYAAQRSLDGQLVRLLLLKNASLETMRNQDGNAPLHAAVRAKNYATLEPLLAYGTPEQISIQNEEGNTPLHDAARLNHILIARCLARTCPNACTIANYINQTPAQRAAFYGNSLIGWWL